MKKSGIGIFSLLLFFSVAIQAAGAEIYVSISGLDSNPGTREKPLASVAMALRKARELRRLNDVTVKSGIRIIITRGIYRLTEPIFIRPEDSGTAESPTIIESETAASAVISGGISLDGWRKAKDRIPGMDPRLQGKIWMANVPVYGSRSIEFRQLWVNNVKAIRARQPDGDSMSRILSWDHGAQTCWIPRQKNILPGQLEGMEFIIHQWWAIAILRIKAIENKGDSMRLSFHQPESRVQSEHPWPAPWISSESGNSAFYLVNSISFLDKPGEWFLDNKNGKLYYYPRPNENMTTAIVEAPFLENLVRLEGTIDHPVSHVYFKGISFCHSGWLRPSHQGHVPHQAGMYMLDAYKLEVPGTPDKKSLENQAWVGRPTAAVEASYTRETGFENCRFEHMASTALDYKKGNHKDSITGNLFKDIGGTAILVGMFSDEATEVHLPYKPSDEREVSREVSVRNNLITDATNEDWGCVGIGAGYVSDIRIEHNQISEVSYTGISLGWGWTPTPNVMKNNRVVANRISHYAKHMYDVAGIYTLSAQPGTLISENYIDSIYKAPYAHIPSHWFYIYTDEGSSHITVKDNWCPSPKFLQNANGPGNAWQNNGPQVSPEIKNRAGLEPGYKSLLKEKTRDSRWPINHQHAGTK